MNERVWVNPRQPQTLYLAQILMYFRGAMHILRFMFGGRVELLGSASIFTAFLLLDTVGLVMAANGIANENKWGYQLGIVAASAPLVVMGVRIIEYGGMNLFWNSVIVIMFDVALVALLLHPMSVEYRRVWFK